ncbi:MAG: pyridoxal-phosphate dependent enzyme [Candidatus Thiodiazotropha sp. (ex Ctena orbiculata)]|uniref:Pyridoxal-phosphate dependent enzyme n=1 Tax=Candidatus Thiodiazotropha taylori TaxID=2792791 RepID=A0A944MDF4_9GAMM|nr:pyridoxal-phosphate dependent enzyme [Candidatus Thiodiazotropha taylori]PUB85110.1 MAG: threonine ammonia-lyase [gamma proteobacterium symbiont of Ctena orbiculata]MBT2989382.1 pyridoxal-phosphate dependent enzyme [Candidatus Thiodiazotropha taylori]MBT2996962.1 pyridoxal-phosphate dependent enzyme [Candidatus Thiodiazotropha taylori]MBT3000817.1 pyridoxal-phosphate dependent enzyme [Candidatus Thiodiazotropha taylori]
MIEHKNYPISYEAVLKARKIVYDHLIPTQLTRYDSLSSLLDAEIFIKHENHNPTGTFKVRGGINLMHHLKLSGIDGVVTFSTGNHGLSIAQSADWFGVKATIVVPENNNPVKNRSIESTGATLVEAGKTFEEASSTVAEIAGKQSLYYAHPANEPHLINGVGTEFVEIIEQIPDLDAVILPIGAGSEAAAAVTVMKTINPDIQIFAVQAAFSSAACQSWKAGKVISSANTTFAGGFATGIAYELPFNIYKDNLEEFVLLSEEEIYQGIALAGYYTHNLLEGAGASTVMAAIKLKHLLKGKKVVLQFSGCNASPDEIRKAFDSRLFSDGWVGE